MFKEALATIFIKKIICFGNKGKYFTLYHRFIISLEANNLTSLSPCATDLTSDR